jgi:hypothetical protein
MLLTFGTKKYIFIKDLEKPIYISTIARKLPTLQVGFLFYSILITFQKDST